MIYTSGANRILSLDEANSSSPVGWAVNTDSGHVLFNDNRTKASWSGNTSNFSYGSGVTLDNNYITMPTVASSSGTYLDTSVEYSNKTDNYSMNIYNKIPWFVTVIGSTTNGISTWGFRNFNNRQQVTNTTERFQYFMTNMSRIDILAGRAAIGTSIETGTWRIYFILLNGGTYYLEPFSLYYGRDSFLNAAWNPTSTPSGYSVSPNCVRPLSYNAAMQSPGVYSNITDAVFKTSLYMDFYVNSGSYGVSSVVENVHIGDLYSTYPSGTSYFTGNNQRWYSNITYYGVSSFALLLYARAPGSIITSYSGSVVSPGTLTLSEGNYRGTAPISAAASGENVITQTN